MTLLIPFHRFASRYPKRARTRTQCGIAHIYRFDRIFFFHLFLAPSTCIGAQQWSEHRALMIMMALKYINFKNCDNWVNVRWRKPKKLQNWDARRWRWRRNTRHPCAGNKNTASPWRQLCVCAHTVSHCWRRFRLPQWEMENSTNTFTSPAPVYCVCVSAVGGRRGSKWDSSSGREEGSGRNGGEHTCRRQDPTILPIHIAFFIIFHFFFVSCVCVCALPFISPLFFVVANERQTQRRRAHKKRG